MEVTLLITENHGIVFLNICENLVQSSWVKVFRIIPEFRTLKLTIQRKSASISCFSDLFWRHLKSIDHLKMKCQYFVGILQVLIFEFLKFRIFVNLFQICWLDMPWYCTKMSHCNLHGWKLFLNSGLWGWLSVVSIYRKSALKSYLLFWVHLKTIGHLTLSFMNIHGKPHPLWIIILIKFHFGT